MYITQIEIALLVGVTISLLFSEYFGISAGGIVAPAYIAMYFSNIQTVILIYFISLLTFLFVKFVLPKYIIIYGRRQFVACIIIATVLKIVFEYFFPLLPFEVYEFRGISIIVPALLANLYFKQGIKLTIISSLVVSIVVFVITTLLYVV